MSAGSRPPRFRFRLRVNGELQGVCVQLPGIPDVGEWVALGEHPYRVIAVTLTGDQGLLDLKSEDLN